MQSKKERAMSSEYLRESLKSKQYWINRAVIAESLVMFQLLFGLSAGAWLALPDSYAKGLLGIVACIMLMCMIAGVGANISFRNYHKLLDESFFKDM